MPGKSRKKPDQPVEAAKAAQPGASQINSGISAGAGFYHNCFTPQELHDLQINQRLAGSGVAAEIDMVRSVARRVLALASGVEELDKAVSALNSLGCAAVRISRLIDQQRNLAESTSELEDALALALREIREEFGLDE